MDTGILTNLLTAFTSAFTLGYGRILPDAQRLLSILAVLEVLFASLWWALDEGKKVEVELVIKIMQIGFFVWVVNNYEWLSNTILRGFIATGEKAGGRGNTLFTDPSLIIDYGFAATDPVFKHIHNYSLISVNKIPDIILSGLAGLLVLLAYFALAITTFITYLEFYLISILGLILIPFSVYKHTSFLGEKVFGAVIAYGIRLMVLAFILAVIEPILSQVTLPEDPSLSQTLTVFLTALTIAGLSWHAPGIASGLLAGSPSLSMGTVMGTGLALGAGFLGAGTAIGSVAHGGYELGKHALAKTRAAAGALSSESSHISRTGGGSSGSHSGGSGNGISATTSAPSISAKGSRSETPLKREGNSMPSWAHNLMLAQQAVPHDAQPGAGMTVPIRTD